VTDRTTGPDRELDDDVDAETAEKVMEIELTREEMHETVEAIGERLTPASIAESAKETVRDATVGKVEEMAQSARGALDDASTTAFEARNGIIDTIRQNPIPAAMAGIGLAWLWTHRSQGQSYTSGDWRRGTSYYGESRYPGETYRYAGNGGGAKDAVTSKVGEVGDRMSDVGDSVSQRVGEGVDTVGKQFDRMGDRMSDVPDQVGYRVHDLSEQARNLIEDSPLAVGAVAVAVGTAIGAALPSTSTERRVLGPAAERAIGTAEEKATEALEQADQRMTEATSGQGSAGTTRGRSSSSGTSASTPSSSSGSTATSGASTADTSADRTRLRQRNASS